MTLHDFIGALDRAGLDLSVDGLLDALWLAQVQRPISIHLSPAPLPELDSIPGELPPLDLQQETRMDTRSDQAPEEATTPPVEETQETIPVFSVAQGEGPDTTFKASPVVVPAGQALPKRLALGRALRPFGRRWASRVDREIDEEATVVASADLGFTYPVFRPRAERWYDAEVVMEDDPTIQVWQDVLRDFSQTLRHTGAFHDVRRWRLRMEQRPLLETPGGIRSSAKFFSGGGMRRLVFFATHGSSFRWADGSYAQLIDQWSDSCSVAVLQLQPPHRWKWTVLGEPHGICRALEPGSPTSALLVDPYWWTPVAAEDAPRIGVPVMLLDVSAIGNFAYMQMGRGRHCPVFLLETSELTPEEIQYLPSPPADPERALAILRESAPLSYRLAVYLAVGAFTLPVARLVQEAMFGDAADQSHLADLLLSGLVLSRQATGQQALDPNLTQYEFKPEVRAILMRSLREADAHRIAVNLEQHLSEYIERIYGRTITFQGLVPDANGDYALPQWAQAFARLGVALLGLPARTAQVETQQQYTDFLLRIVAPDSGDYMIEAFVDSSLDSTLLVARAPFGIVLELRQSSEIKDWGSTLSRALFPDPLRNAYDALKKPARIRLDIDQRLAHLHEVPWERATLPDGTPLSVPFARYIAASSPAPKPISGRQIRMSICVANPYGTSMLAELRSLFGTLSGHTNLDVTLLTGRTILTDEFRSEISRVGWRVIDEASTVQSFAARLASDDFVHLIVPGFWSREEARTLMLVLDGQIAPDSELAATAGHRLPRLVTLQFTDTSSSKTAPPSFAVVAERIVRAGAGAALVMEGQLTSGTQPGFIHSFYRKLLETGLVDHAAAAARTALRESAAPDWWTPVLYTRLRDCRLFVVGQGPSPRAVVESFESAYEPFVLGRVARFAATTRGEQFDASALGEQLSQSLERMGLLRQSSAGNFRFLPGIEPLLAEMLTRRPVLGVRILWVDDHPANNVTAARELRTMGADIAQALTTEEAMQSLEKHDVIISDMARQDQGLAGLDLILRLQQRRIATPVIIFANWFAATRSNDALRAGAFGCTNVLSELHELVRQAVSSRHASTLPHDIRARRMLGALRQIGAAAERAETLLDSAAQVVAGFALQVKQDRAEIFQSCLQLIKAYTDCTVVQLIAANADELHVIADIADNQENRYKIASWEGVIGQAAKEGHSVWVPDVSRHTGYIAAEPSTRSELAIPLLSKRSLVGVVNIEIARTNVLSENDIAWLEAFCEPLTEPLRTSQPAQEPPAGKPSVRLRQKSPAWELAFDEHGKGAGTRLAERFARELKKRDINDVLMLVHGWNHDRVSAHELLGAFQKSFQQIDNVQFQQLGTIAVLWPSKLWSDEQTPPEQTVAEGGKPRLTGSEMRKVDELVERVQTKPDDLESLEGLRIAMNQLPQPASESSAESRGFLSDWWQAAKNVLRMTTYYQMRRRAALIGREGFAPFLTELRRASPDLRIHLVAHSMGARLAGYALTLTETRIQSLSLLQAMISDHALDPSGPLAPALLRVDGPVIVTYSRNDPAAKSHELFMRVVGRDEDAPSHHGDYQPLGLHGAQGVPAVEVKIQPPGSPYFFEPGRIYNVDATRTIMSHVDVVNHEVAWLVMSAAGGSPMVAP